MVQRSVVRALLVDIDSTLYPMAPLIARQIELIYGVTLSGPDLKRWSPWEVIPGLPADGRDRIIGACQTDEVILGIEPFVGAVETLQAWAKRGVEIHVVSDRVAATAPATTAWLDRIGVPRIATILQPGVDKLAYAKAHGLDLIIDDKADFIASAASAGFPVATIEHGYNAAEREANPEIVAADTWPLLRSRLEARFRFGNCRRRGADRPAEAAHRSVDRRTTDRLLSRVVTPQTA